MKIKFRSFYVSIVLLLVLFSSSEIFAFSYFNISVWNDRKSYDSNYFTEGTFNDITAGIVIKDFSGDPNSLNFQVEWPEGAVTDTEAIPFHSFFYGMPTYVKILGHDVASTSFTDWENITYDFSELGGVLPQPPDVFIGPGIIKELAIPTITSYDPLTHSIVWENNYATGEISNFRVRIYGSTDTDDISFDSGGIDSSSNTYTFTDPFAINLLDAGSIFGVEARKFKSSTEIENISIYITRTENTWETVYDTLFDNPSDLEILRQYRDEVLSKTTKGNKYKILLYQSSEAALEVLLENPELMAKAKDLIYTNILAVDDVINGQEGIIYKTEKITAFLDAYAKKAPPTLKTLARTVRWHMLNNQKKGKLFFGFRLE